MRDFRKLLTALLVGAALAPLSGNLAGAADAVANRKDNPQPRSAARRWTEQRYLGAEPRSLPTAPGGAGSLSPAAVPRGGESVAQPERVVEGSGGGPAVRLYRPIDKHGAADDGAADNRLAPQAVTEEGAAFSQSRVFPPGAVRNAPYHRTGKLFSYDETADVIFECTGAVIQQRLVLTAAHCLYTFEDGAPRFLDDFEFFPAFDRAPRRSAAGTGRR